MGRGRVWMVGMLLAALASGCSDVGRNEIRVRRTREAGQRAVVVENSRIRVAVLPDLGGRVSEYALKATRHNELWTSPGMTPPAEAGGADACGGLDDPLDVDGRAGGSARLASQPYACDVTRSAENVTVTLTWRCPTWKIERSHTVFRNATRLFTRVVVTNLDNAPRELAARPRVVFAVGGDADNNDFVLQPTEGAALVRRCGAPLETDLARPAGAWAGIVDTKKNEAVVQVFQSGVDELDLRFEKTNVRVAPVQLPRALRPGESAAMSFDMFLLSGKDLAKEARALPVNAAAAGEMASALGMLLSDRRAFSALEAHDFYLTPWGPMRLGLPPSLAIGANPLRFTVDVLPFRYLGPAPEVVATLTRRSDGKPMTPPECEKTEFMQDLDAASSKAAGYNPDVFHADSYRSGYRLPVSGLEDGVYTLQLVVGDNATKSRISTDVVVSRKLRDRVEASKAAEKDESKPTYAAARWYVEEARRVAEDAAGNAPPAPSVYRRVEGLLATSRNVLDGKSPTPKSATFPRFYFSTIDDSVQGCLVTLPDNYTAAKKWPCLVSLHDREAGDPPFDPDRRVPWVESLAGRSGIVVVEPHGRGNQGFRGPGADDVMDALSRTRADFSIDPDRVYLMGVSMGGAGTWWLGQRFPGVFAGIAPLFGATDYRVGIHPDELQQLPLWRRWWIESNSAVSFAGNLLNTAVYLYHGVRDKEVDVEHSRRMVGRFAELGHRDWVYEEDPRGEHVVPPRLPGEMLDFLLDFKLERAPKNLTVVSPYLRWARGGWARMDALDRSCEFGELRARADGQELVVETRNVSGFTLEPTKDLLDVTKPFAVTVDGESAFLIESAGGGRVGVSFRLESDARTEEPRWVRGASAKSARGVLVKDANVEGPISDVFRSRFILVPGTLGDNATDAACREEAERTNRERWRAVQHVDCLIRTDRELTAEDRRDANLVLLGGPDVNAVTKELAAALPVTFGKDGAITMEGRTLRGPAAGVAFVYPNPNNPERCVLVLAATTPEGFRGILSRVRPDFDYYAFDVGTRATGSWRDAETAVLFGFFDQKWKFDKRSQWGRPPAEPETRLK